jgi:hypothetical protein
VHENRIQPSGQNGQHTKIIQKPHDQRYRENDFEQPTSMRPDF